MLFRFVGTGGVRFGSIEGCLHHDVASAFDTLRGI